MKMKFTEVFSDNTKNGKKIQTIDYLPSGNYPIIDQGRECIAGYSNMKEGVFVDVPAIVFGDHTRIVKYVDTPFFLGADGVKVFRCKIDKADYKYLFYCLQAMRIPDTGYNRHFKWLKESYIPLPPLDEQRRIAAVLDKVSDLIAKRRQQLEKLDELVKARFVEMFGDPLGKSKYARERIAQLGGVGTGNTPSMRVAKYYASDDIPFVKPSDMLENGVAIIADGTAFIAEAARTVARIVPAASVLVTCIGTIGKVGITSCECACNQQINYVTPRDDINVIYLAHCLSHCKQLLVEMSNAPVVPIINKSQFSAIEIPVPPLEQQKQFGSFFEQTGKVKSIISRDLEKLEILKKSLMQRYFE